MTLNDVILRHGGEAQPEDAYASLSRLDRQDMLSFLAR
jgi:CxxC motif-containing protein (DUF1111 family)